jgi:fumarylacetoacetate (FAA) hydrolase family protein
MPTVVTPAQSLPWTFCAGALMRTLAQRKLL